MKTKFHPFSSRPLNSCRNPPPVKLLEKAKVNQLIEQIPINHLFSRYLFLFLVMVAIDAPAQSTEAEWHAQAVKSFPELGQEGSAFHQLFGATVEKRRSEMPTFFNDPQWPVTLANELADRPEFTVEQTKNGRLVEYENQALSAKISQLARTQGAGIVKFPATGNIVTVKLYDLVIRGEGRIKVSGQSSSLRAQFPDVDFSAPVAITGKYNRLRKQFLYPVEVKNAPLPPLDPGVLYLFKSSQGAEMKAYFIRRDGTNVILKSEDGQEKSFAIQIFSLESKHLLAELIGMPVAKP